MVARKRDERKYDKRFGAYIKRKRLKKYPKLSGVKFAQSLDISGPYLSNIELGKVPPPSEDVVIAIAEKLEEDRHQLLSMAGYVDPEYLPILKELPPEAMHALKLIDEGLNLINPDVSMLDIIAVMIGVLSTSKPSTFGDILRSIADLIDNIELSENLPEELISMRDKGIQALRSVSSMSDLIPSSLIQDQSED